MRQPTHCERLLEVLRDGRPHDHLSLYGLRMIVHSRVADLRNRGYVIECWRDGELSYYRLLSEPALPQGAASPAIDGAEPVDARVTATRNGSPDLDAAPCESAEYTDETQLVLGGVAA